MQVFQRQSALKKNTRFVCKSEIGHLRKWKLSRSGGRLYMKQQWCLLNFYGKYLFCVYAHTRVPSIDVEVRAHLWGTAFRLQLCECQGLCQGHQARGQVPSATKSSHQPRVFCNTCDIVLLSERLERWLGA